MTGNSIFDMHDTRDLRVGLIGFGSIAEHGHLPALQSFPEIDVVAVADLSPDRLQRAHVRVPDAVLYDSPAALIAEADVDALDICTPPNTHADLMLAACRQGVADIVCEKPFVLSEEEYRAVARARSLSRSRIISMNNWRYSDLNTHMTRVLAAGLIGEVREVLLRTGRPDHARGNNAWMPDWRTNQRVSGGGILLDHGWHQLYLVLGWMSAPVLSVRARMRTSDPRHAPVEDEAQVELTFPHALARLELSWTARERSNDGTVRGTKGEIAIYDDRIVVHNGHIDRTVPFQDRLTQSSYHPEWFQEVLRTGILDRDSGEAPRNFSEAGQLVSLISAAYRSAHAGGESVKPELVVAAGEDPERKDVCYSSGNSPQ